MNAQQVALASFQKSLDIRSSYADWLSSKSWDLFATITFRRPTRNAYSALRKTGDCLAFDLGVARGFLAAEPHRSGDVHIHALLGTHFDKLQGSGVPVETFFQEHLSRRYGRSRVERIKGHDAVCAYVAKYVLKGQREWDHYSIIGGKWEWR